MPENWKIDINRENLSDEETQLATANLVEDLRSNFSHVIPSAPSSEKVLHSKGDPITIGTIILSAISSGSLVALVGCLRAAIEKNRRLKIEITDPIGKNLKIDASNVHGKETLAALEGYFRDSRQK